MNLLRAGWITLAVVMALRPEQTGDRRPVKFRPEVTVDNGTSSPLVFQDNGRTVLTIKEGDMPAGPCDLGDLVRAVRKHLDLEHPEQPAWDGTISATAIPAIAHIPCRLNATDAQCRVYEAEAAVKQAQAALEAEKLRADTLGDLRLKLAACEVAK